jgi:hypothetical protein
MLRNRGECHLGLGGRQVIDAEYLFPGVVGHQSVSSVMDSENVPASLLMAEIRCPGEHRWTCTTLAGRNVLGCCAGIDNRNPASAGR